MLWEFERHAGDGWLYHGAEQRRISYQELGDMVVAIENALASETKLLVALLCDNSPACIAAYLAALRCGHTVVLLNALSDSALQDQILQEYRPEILAHCGSHDAPAGYHPDSCPVPALSLLRADSPCGAPIHPDTAVLLSTSGTTGSPKLVRLSYRNIQANAESIARYLEITGAETAITSLPLNYSYGLSVVNSHLLAGANLVCTEASLVSKDFWQLFKECGCTSLAGVPYSYLLLERLRFGRMELPALKTLTQAGGRLPLEKVKAFSELARQRDLRFFVMYGQTEATARIAYIPHDRLHEKIGSVGIAIPGGRIDVLSGDAVPSCPPLSGEIVYTGPNVMLGYAEMRADLAMGDVLGGILHTGDLGYLDNDGYLFITGRLKRFIKVFGLRMNLDDVERMLENALSVPVACLGQDDELHLLVESERDGDLHEATRRTTELYQIHHSAVHAHRTSSLPVTASGKKDYTTMEKDLKLK